MILRNMFQKRERVVSWKRVPWEGMEFDSIELSIHRTWHLFSVSWASKKLNLAFEIFGSFTVEYQGEKHYFSQRSTYNESSILFDLVQNPIVSFYTTNKSSYHKDDYSDVEIVFSSGHCLRIVNIYADDGFEEYWRINHGSFAEIYEVGGYHFTGAWETDDKLSCIELPGNLYVDDCTATVDDGIEFIVIDNQGSNTYRVLRIRYPLCIRVDQKEVILNTLQDIKQYADQLPDTFGRNSCGIFLDDEECLHVTCYKGSEFVSGSRIINKDAWEVLQRTNIPLDYPNDINEDEYSIPVERDMSKELTEN